MCTNWASIGVGLCLVLNSCSLWAYHGMVHFMTNLRTEAQPQN